MIELLGEVGGQNFPVLLLQWGPHNTLPAGVWCELPDSHLAPMTFSGEE